MDFCGGLGFQGLLKGFYLGSLQASIRDGGQVPVLLTTRRGLNVYCLLDSAILPAPSFANNPTPSTNQNPAPQLSYDCEERFHALSTRLDAANAGERDMLHAPHINTESFRYSLIKKYTGLLYLTILCCDSTQVNYGIFLKV